MTARGQCLPRHSEFSPSLILTAGRRGEGDGAEAPRLLAAYGAPRRHSRACSGIQRNKGNHLWGIFTHLAVTLDSRLL